MELPQRKNIRKPGHNYNDVGSYFITICTKHREHFFGEIKDQNIILTDLGRYTRDCRKEIPRHFPFVEVGEFICMPDHIHGTIIIKSDREENNTAPENNRRDGLSSVRQNILDRTKNISSLHGATSGSLGSIVRGFKIGITKFAHKNNISFARQSRYYDHIIIDEKELFLIEQYIRNNPKDLEEKEYER